MVSEQKTRQVPYCVSKQVPYTSTRRVCKLVPKQVEQTCTRMVARQVLRQVPYTRCSLVPETVCCASMCAPGSAGILTGCANGDCAGSAVTTDAAKPVNPTPDPVSNP
jgi:hypothetical protein